MVCVYDSLQQIHIPHALCLSLMPEPDWDLIARCLSGEASPEEQDTLSEWTREDPVNAGVLAEMEELWDAVHTDEAPRDVHSAWTRFRRQSGKVSGRAAGLTLCRSAAGDNSSKPCLRSSRSAQHRSGSRARQQHRIITYYAGILALTVILVLAGVLLYGNEAGPSQMAAVETSSGEQAVVELPHGITVRLNAESRLTYERQRPRSASIVATLQGEAFFDVPPRVRRTDTPALVVETTSVQVRVLGTRFNLRAYGGDEPLEVAVEKGLVDVELQDFERSASGAVKRRLYLHKGEGARHEPGGALESFVLSSPGIYFGWTDRHLVLRDASVAEVMRRLERWYGTELELREGTTADGRLSATFHGETLAEALEVVNSVLDVTIARAPSRSEAPTPR